MNPITGTTIWMSPTLYFAHKTYPPYLNIWVNFCALLGVHICMVSSINLALSWQPPETTIDS